MKNMKCPVCDSKKYMKLTHKTIKYDIGGAPFVTLKNVPHHECDECGEVSVEIPKPLELHKMIAEHLATRQPGLLMGEQIRFIRKYLGHSTADYADILGIDSKSLSRIESGQRHSEALDRTIRTHALMKSPKRDYKEIVDSIRQQDKPVRRLIFNLDKKGFQPAFA